MNNHKKIVLSAAVFSVLASNWGIAETPTANSQGQFAGVALEEVIVTAQRRSERLQDVGISLVAHTGDDLKLQGVMSTTDIANLSPGINLSGTLGGQGVQFSIRGVTQADYNDAIEAPVAVYIDGTYVSSQQGQSSALFDLDRVEALKGPQGTLFGRNATGGLVNFIVKTPNLNETEGYIDMRAGRFNQASVEGALNFPLSDIMALRASVFYNSQNSIWDNKFPEGYAAGAPLNFGPSGVSPSGQDLGDEEEVAGRIQLLIEPNDSLSIRLTGSTYDQKLSESPWTSSAQIPVIDENNLQVNSIYASATESRAAIGPNGENFFNPNVLAFQGFLYSPNNDGHRVPGANYFGYVPLDADNLELSKDYALSDLNRFRTYNGAVHVDWDLTDSVQLTSVTSYWKYKKHFLLDADGSPANAFAFGTLSETKTFTQELRLSGSSESLEWQTGIFYLDIDADVAQGLLAPRGSALSAVFDSVTGGVFGFVNTGVDPLSVFNLQTSSSSVFGQASWHFSDQWTLVFGARLIREEQQYQFDSFATANISDYSVDLGDALFPLQPSFTDDRTDNLWAGKLQLEYRPNDQLLVYTGVNRGVKAGSYNGKLFDGSPPLAASEIPYEPEELVSYEAGFKYTGDNNRYILNGAAFHYDYKNYQSFVFADISGFVQNQEATTNGVELEATIQATSALRASASVAYVDAEVEDLEIAPGVFRDTAPTYTPEKSASAKLVYSISGLPVGELDLFAVANYQSSFYHNGRNFSGDRFSGRTLVDLSARWQIDENFYIGGYTNNIFDKRYKSVGLNLSAACGCNLEAYGQPRTWGLSVGYEF